MKRMVILFLLMIPIINASTVNYNSPEKISFEEVQYKISLFLENNTIIQEDYIQANITILYFNDSQKRQYSINYLITDKNDDIIIKDTRSIVVEKELNFMKEFYIPKSIESGNYKLNIEVTYLNYTTKESSDFYVSEKIDKNYYLNYILYIIIITGILLMLLLIIFERNKLKNIEKEYPKETRKIYEEFRKKKQKEETLRKLRKQLSSLNEARNLRVISRNSYETASDSLKKLIKKIEK